MAQSLNLHLEIAARGWNHAGWSGRFYPETLPEEWRLTYYSNEFRRVLVPARQAAAADAEVIGQWREDVHGQFRFLIELRIDADHQTPGADQLQRLQDGLGALLGGVLVVMPASARAPFVALRRALDQPVPVYVDAEPSLERACAELIDEAGAGLCWRPAGAGARGARRLGLLQADEVAGGLRELRSHIDEFLSQAPATDELLLVFEGSPPALDAMNEAKVIASLLGV
jgi:hypothetical protein